MGFIEKTRSERRGDAPHSCALGCLLMPLWPALYVDLLMEQPRLHTKGALGMSCAMRLRADLYLHTNKSRTPWPAQSVTDGQDHGPGRVQWRHWQGPSLSYVICQRRGRLRQGFVDRRARPGPGPGPGASLWRTTGL